MHLIKRLKNQKPCRTKNNTKLQWFDRLRRPARKRRGPILTISDPAPGPAIESV